MHLTSQDAFFKGFQFDLGDELPALRIHYRTLGRLRHDAAGRPLNAVLWLHGTSGSGDAFLRDSFAGPLFRPGQPLDAEKYFIILPDGIGHGGSSRPSDGLRTSFPRYRYADMVRAYRMLVQEELGIERLRLIAGTSMGGMHAWMWGGLHPQEMDALFPLASLPAPITGRNRMLRRMIIDGIRWDPAWRNGDYESDPPGLRHAAHILLLMVACPLQMQIQAPTAAAADRLFDEMVDSFLSRLDATDLLYQVEASTDYDPVAGLEKIEAALTAVNFGDDLVNPPELSILEEAIKRVAGGRAIVLPASDKTHGHRSHSIPELWSDALLDLLHRSRSS